MFVALRAIWVWGGGSEGGSKQASKFDRGQRGLTSGFADSAAEREACICICISETGRGTSQSVCGLSVGVICVREKMHSGERTGDVLHDTVELDGAADRFVDDCA